MWDFVLNTGNTVYEYEGLFDFKTIEMPTNRQKIYSSWEFRFMNIVQKKCLLGNDPNIYLIDNTLILSKLYVMSKAICWKSIIIIGIQVILPWNQ